MRVLFFLQPGANSRRIFQDMIRGFERAGHQTLVMELAPIWKAYQDNPASKRELMSAATSQLKKLVEAHGIDLTMGMWGNALGTFMNVMRDGVPCTFFDAVGLPHLLYWLDAPHWAQSNSVAGLFKTPIVSGPMLTHFINNPATGEEMTDILGFGRTIPAPYGINEDALKPPANMQPDHDVVLCVGPGDPAPTPLALRELDSDDPDTAAIRREAAAAARAELDALLAGTNPQAREGVQAVLHLLVDSQLNDRSTPMLHRLRAIAAGPGGHAPAADTLLADPRLYVRATMIIRRIESWERPFTASYLSRRFRCAAFGQNNLAAWGFRGADLGQPDHEAQSAAYARGRLAVNLMRWQDDVGLNLKPYEITASGVACLCVRRGWMDRSFVDGGEVASFSNPREAAEQARSLLEDEPRRAALAQAGLERTRRDHTWTARASEMIAALPHER